MWILPPSPSYTIQATSVPLFSMKGKGESNWLIFNELREEGANSILNWVHFRVDGSSKKRTPD